LMLQIQYRMHPKISQFSSTHFYDGKIEDGVTSSDKLIPKGFNWPQDDIPVAFVSVENSMEEKSSIPGTKTKHNMEEAKIIYSIINQIVEKGDISVADIGVISPYSGQVKLLTDIFNQNNGIKKGGKYHRLNINTVDGYQGREKQMIIVSTVRSNEKGNVGFLKDWRRLNVSITRACRGLIVVGNFATLSRDEHWKKWLDWINENSLQVDNEYISSLQELYPLKLLTYLKNQYKNFDKRKKNIVKEMESEGNKDVSTTGDEVPEISQKDEDENFTDFSSSESENELELLKKS